MISIIFVLSVHLLRKQFIIDHPYIYIFFSWWLISNAACINKPCGYINSKIPPAWREAILHHTTSSRIYRRCFTEYSWEEISVLRVFTLICSSVQLGIIDKFFRPFVFYCTSLHQEDWSEITIVPPLSDVWGKFAYMDILVFIFREL